MATKNIVHVRRCHVCGTVNELTNAALHKCGHCGKHFAPFYYFEEKEDPAIGDNVLITSLWRLTPKYHPLLGFSTYWEDDFQDTG